MELSIPNTAPLRESIRVCTHLNKVEIDELLLISVPAGERRVEVLMKKVKDLDEITEKLHRPDRGIRSARNYPDTVHEIFSSLLNRPHLDAQIIRNTYFELDY